LVPSFVEAGGLALAAPLAAAALILLVAAIASLTKVARGVDLAAIPLAPLGAVDLACDGEVALWLEGPQLVRVPGELRVTLRERSSGIVVESRRPWLRARVRALRTARRELLRFALPRPGAYEVLVEGLAGAALDARLRLRFTRPTGAAVLPRVLAIAVALGVLGGLLSSAELWRALGESEKAREDAASATVPRAPGGGARAGGRAGEGNGGGGAVAGGRPVLAQAAATAGWREVEWPAGGLRLRAPADFRETSDDPQELMLRESGRGLYLGLRLTPFGVVVPEDALLAVLRQNAAAQLAAGALQGWAARDLGPARGVVEVPARGALAAVWRGYVERGGRLHALDILIGGGREEDRAALEADFAAVLESLRFD